MSATLTIQQLEKLGNTLIYLSRRVSSFNKTKILKLLFLLEEASIKKFGTPFFGFDFQVWKHGPVLKEVYVDLSDDSVTLLKKFIKKADHNSTEFEAIRDFSDDEFSDNDIEIMELIINFAKSHTAKDLVNYTHSENSLWKQTAIKNDVLEDLESGRLNTTNFNIDFSLLFENDEFLKQRYEHAVESMQFINHLKK